MNGCGFFVIVGLIMTLAFWADDYFKRKDKRRG